MAKIYISGKKPDHVFSEPAIKKLQTEITELKQSLQIIYDARTNRL